MKIEPPSLEELALGLAPSESALTGESRAKPFQHMCIAGALLLLAGLSVALTHARLPHANATEAVPAEQTLRLHSQINLDPKG